MNGRKPFSPKEVEALRRSGEILARSMQKVIRSLQPGVSAAELDRCAEVSIRSMGGVPSFKGYRGYPASLCVSRNDEVVHGIPRPSTILAVGDIVGLDLGASYHGIHTDMATTIAVGRSSVRARQLLEVTRSAIAAALAAVKPKAWTGDIGAAVQGLVERAGFGVVRDLVGHGVGRSIHEEPSIPNFGEPGTGTELKPGMALAIEPMVTMGDYAVSTDDDGWTVRTRDGSLAAHEERTVLVTEGGYELLTPL